MKWRQVDLVTDGLPGRLRIPPDNFAALLRRHPVDVQQAVLIFVFREVQDPFVDAVGLVVPGRLGEVRLRPVDGPSAFLGKYIVRNKFGLCEAVLQPEVVYG